MTERADVFAHLKGVALTDIGRKRKNNEDACGAFPAQGVWCVADGMGGGDDGEVASAAVVKSVDAYLSDLPEQTSGAYGAGQLAGGIVSAIEEASGWIYRRTKKKQLKGCGSTFVGIVFDPTSPNTAIALHVGDSRLYRLRGKELKQITKDHSVAEMMGAKDESQLNPMFRGMILRAVGIESSVEVDRTPMSIAEGDVVLICSDGLSRMVPDKRIAEIVRDGGEEVTETAKRLIAAANEAGGIDNITVALIKVGALPSALPAVALERGDDSSSSHTVQTLEREYGFAGRWFSRRVLIGLAAVCAVAAFGWAVSGAFTREKPQPVVPKSIEALPTVSVVPEKSVPPAPSVAVTDVPKPVMVLHTAVVERVAQTVQDQERDAVAEELRAARERRKHEEEIAAGLEQERRQLAQELAETYERSFVEFAIFANAVFGKGTSDRAESLSRRLHERRKDVDVTVCATDFTTEIAAIAARLIAKYDSQGLDEKGATVALLKRCRAVVGKDPSSAETQRMCLELIEFVAEQRARRHDRK